MPRVFSPQHCRERETRSALCLLFEHDAQSQQRLIFAHTEDPLTALENGPDSHTSGWRKRCFSSSPWMLQRLGIQGRWRPNHVVDSDPWQDRYKCHFFFKNELKRWMQSAKGDTKSYLWKHGKSRRWWSVLGQKIKSCEILSQEREENLSVVKLFSVKIEKLFLTNNLILISHSSALEGKEPFIYKASSSTLTPKNTLKTTAFIPKLEKNGKLNGFKTENMNPLRHNQNATQLKAA